MRRRKPQLRKQLPGLDADAAKSAALAGGRENPADSVSDAHGLSRHGRLSSPVANWHRWGPGLAGFGYHDKHWGPFRTGRSDVLAEQGRHTG
jgi:hypothetical protein